MVEPALSAEEWSECVFSEQDGDDAVTVDCQGEAPGIFTVTPLVMLHDGDYAGSFGVGMGERQRVDIERRYAVAALALHGMPNGFTREDVDLLYQLSDNYESHPGHGSLGLGARELAGRIEALLPSDNPRE
jgi:hypothetical protein